MKYFILIALTLTSAANLSSLDVDTLPAKDIKDLIKENETHKGNPLNPLHLVNPEECALRREMCIYYLNCINERIDFIEYYLESNFCKKELVRLLNCSKSDLDLVKLLLGVPINELKNVDQHVIFSNLQEIVENCIIEID